MQVISKINPELLTILEDFSNFFFSKDRSSLEASIGSDPSMKEVSKKEMSEEATSNKYLEEALKRPPLEFGFPRHSWGLELALDRKYFKDNDLVKKCNEIDKKLLDFFGARNNALQMYYPPGGYIGWHTNCNAPGYNIVISCNPGADGYFVHYDHINKKYNYFYDKPGWNVKAGYFGSVDEPDKMYWHAARTNTPRLTLSYIVYDKNIWLDMMDDIEVGERITEDL